MEIHPLYIYIYILWHSSHWSKKWLFFIIILHNNVQFEEYLSHSLSHCHIILTKLQAKQHTIIAHESKVFNLVFVQTVKRFSDSTFYGALLICKLEKMYNFFTPFSKLLKKCIFCSFCSRGTVLYLLRYFNDAIIVMLTNHWWEIFFFNFHLTFNHNSHSFYGANGIMLYCARYVRAYDMCLMQKIQREY